jgi:hypothetical protein
VEDLEFSVAELHERVRHLYAVLSSATGLVHEALDPAQIDLREVPSATKRKTTGEAT